MKVLDLLKEGNERDDARDLLKTSSQWDKTLPILEPDLRRELEKGEGRVNATKDLWKGN